MTRLADMAGVALLAAACASHPPLPQTPAAGRLLVAGTHTPVRLRVVGANESPGFDAAKERCRFDPSRVLPRSPSPGCATPRRWDERTTRGLSATVARSVAEHGWDRETLAERVDLIVIHYDAAVTSHRCFEVLHDERGLSAHFLLDVDGTVYQTLDLALRARHAGTANDRSVGIEIAHVGAYEDAAAFAGLYTEDPEGLALSIPPRLCPPPGGPFRPARSEYVRGTVNGRSLVQPDFTGAQYASLATLVDELCRAFPRVRRDVPRGPDGAVLDRALSPAELAAFSGVVGHWHVTPAKVDPGPALDWDRVLGAPVRP